MLEDSRASILISRSHFIRGSEHADPMTDPAASNRDRPHHVLLDKINPYNKQNKNGLKPINISVDLSSAAYVLYTSGSTGKPKGVVVPHRALSTFMKACIQQNILSSNDVLLALTTIGFDIAGLELFLPLLCGGTLVIADQQDHRNPERILELMGQHHVTVVQATPTLWSMLNLEESAPKVNMLVGGEALPKELARKLVQSGNLTNLYGPTEATIWATMHTVQAQDIQADSPATISIGKPLPGYHVFVLDKNLEPVPCGVQGDIYIAGDALAQGYLGRPGLTASTFLACPWLGSGARMYQTGDTGQLKKDGSIDYLGRNDTQVKVRGHRIELGEIEAAMGGCFGDSISQVIVTTQKLAGDMKLIAYVLPHPGQTLPTISIVREKLVQKLPEYMAPDFLIQIDEVPLTANGKIDRRSLPELQGATADRPYRAPVTDHEKLICRLFSELTGMPQVGVDDRFFSIGGHSLLAMKLISSLRTKTGVSISLQSFFANPTPAAIARQMELDTKKPSMRLTKGLGKLDGQ